MNIFKRMYGIIVKPKQTIKEISEEPSIWQAIIIIAGLALIPVLLIINNDVFISLVTNGDITSVNRNVLERMVEFRSILTIIMVFSAMILSPIFHFIGTAVYNLICEFFGYSGKGKELFTTLAFAKMPSIISSIVGIILVTSQMRVISHITSIAFGIWVIVLSIFAIKETYSMSGGKATLIYFIPVIIGIIIAIIVSVLIVSSITMISSLMPSYNPFL